MKNDVLISRISIVGLTAIFAYLFIYHYHHQIRGEGLHVGDFSTFYLAAQYAREHRDIYTAGINPDLIYVYPPLIAFVCTPLTLLSMARAAQVALLLNTLMLFATVVLAARAMLRRLNCDMLSLTWPVALVVSLLSFAQMRTVLTMGETDALMLFLFMLAFYWLDSKPTLAGGALAVALNIKYLSIVAIPYFLLRRRWKALAAMIFGAVFCALIPAVLLGWKEDLRCLRVSLGGLLVWVGVPRTQSHAIRVHNISDAISVSATSSLGRVLGPHGLSNAGIMISATTVALLSLAIVWHLYRSHQLPLWAWPQSVAQREQPYRGLLALEWSGLVTVALVFSPDTNTRHLVLAVLVNTLAVVLALTARPTVSRTPAIAGAALIFLAFIMPFGRASDALHAFYYRYSIPGWGLLIGYLLILWTGLQHVSISTRIPTTDRRV